MRDWLTFRSGNDGMAMLEEWNKTTSEFASRVLGVEGISVKVVLPDEDAVRFAWEKNHDLKGCVRIEGIEFADGNSEMPIALPFNGVFLSRAKEGIHPNLLVWDNCLVEKTGITVVNSSLSPDRESPCWRLGLPNGNYFDVPMPRKQKDSTSPKPNSRNARKFLGSLRELELAKRMYGIATWPYCSNAERLFAPNIIRHMEGMNKDVREIVCGLCLKKLGEVFAPNIIRYMEGMNKDVRELVCGICFEKLGEAFSECLGVSSAKDSEEIKPAVRDDLCHRVVWTFPRWLQHRICKRLLLRQNDVLKKKIGLYDLFYGLVPLVGKGALDRTAGDLVYVFPENAIDLMAHIYGVKRFSVARKDAEHFPAACRQNHPSFEGKICPIESPESELVGISLQIANGATVDKDGVIIEAPEASGCQTCLGWGTSLIPFMHHNDGARNMMGAKNLRQTVLSEQCESPLVKSGGEERLLKAASPFLTLGLCPGEKDELKFGHNLLVAYMPWYGWNVDDAVVISETTSRRMAVTKRKVFSSYLAKGWNVNAKFRNALEVKYQCRQPDGLSFESWLRDEGFEVKQGDSIVELAKNDEKLKLRIVKYEDPDPAVVRFLSFPKAGEGVALQKISYVLERSMPLRVGDKLMGRHGNKGVVAKILRDDEMPKLNCGGQEESRSDILLNPHGVLSRMNPGQLLETHLGWLFKHGVDESQVRIEGKDCSIGYPLRGIVDHKKVRQYLKDYGLDDKGRTILEWEHDGRRVVSENPIVVGYQYFVRLNHIPELKAQVRRGGADSRYDVRSGNAAHGRSVGGGQRAGEMEMWALRAHRARAVLGEMVGVKSDPTLLVRSVPELLPKGKDILDSGFGRYFRTWLRAVFVDVRHENGELVFKRLECDSLQALERSSGCKFDIVRAGEKTIVTDVRCFCEKCGSCRPYLEQVFTAHKLKEHIVLLVEDLLAKFRLRIWGCVRSLGENKYAQEVVDANDEHYELELQLGKRNKNRHTFRVLTSHVPDLQMKGIESFYCVNDSLKAKRDARKNEIVDPFENKLREGLLSLAEFKVSCPEHPGTVLEGQNESDEKMIGGLHDEDVFGNSFDLFSSGDEKWGCIELPEPVEARDVFSRIHSRNFLGLDINRKKEDDEENGNKFDDFKIKFVPVLPRRYRMPMCEDGFSGGACSDVIDSEGYGPLLDSVRWWRGLLEKPSPDDKKLLHARDAVRKALSQLLTMLMERMVDKDGLIRHEGLGRRVDRSFRLVIVPDPTLKVDECRIPLGILNEVGGEQQQVVAEPANRSKNERRCRSVGWSWLANSACHRQPSSNVKRGEYVLLNRQPSLHRDSVLAFRPLLDDDKSASSVLRIPPLACKCFGADFDGDEMVGHATRKDACLEEARKMTLRDNLISIDSGDLTYNLDRDTVSGIRLLYQAHELPKVCEDFCREHEGAKIESPDQAFEKSEMEKWLRNVCEDSRSVAADFIHALSVRAFEKATKNGCSFGYYDLYDCEHKLEERSDAKIAQSGALETIVASKANGDGQIDQYVISRGVLKPGKTGFLKTEVIEQMCSQLVGDGVLSDATGFKFANCTLVSGMTWNEIFQSSYNARSSMCDKKLSTAQSGDLTRKLVFSLQHIHDEDGSPSGLIAALAIGERGTQLSMKSAHTSGGKNDFEEVRYIIYRGYTHYEKEDLWGKWVRIARTAENKNGRAKIETWDAFKETILGVAPGYKKVDERHFKLLWGRLRELGGSLLDEEGRFRGVPINSKIDGLVFSTGVQASYLRKWLGSLVEDRMSMSSSMSSIVMFKSERE